MMTRLEDMLPPGTEAVWTCGHTGGAVCKECHYLALRRIEELEREVDNLCAELTIAGLVPTLTRR